MKVKKFFVIASITSLAFTACGGSSDDGAGQLSAFQVVPDSVEIQSAGATCPLTKAGEFAVIGGTAPYTVLSPFHQLVAFGAPGGVASSTVGSYTVPNRNGQFAIYIQGCFEPAVVTVMDDLKRVVTIEVSYAASAAN
jgi:hypothetical protein